MAAPEGLFINYVRKRGGAILKRTPKFVRFSVGKKGKKEKKRRKKGGKKKVKTT
jgi:hypothetical protein